MAVDQIELIVTPVSLMSIREQTVSCLLTKSLGYAARAICGTNDSVTFFAKRFTALTPLYAVFAFIVVSAFVTACQYHHRIAT